MCNEAECVVGLLVKARSLLTYAGTADVVLATGEHAHQLRCAPHDGRLIVLVPRSSRFPVPGVGGKDLPARVLIQQRSPTNPDRLSALMLTGWLSELRERPRLEAADAFVARHPTGDLLDLDGDWLLAALDVAEAHLGTPYGGFALDSTESLEQLFAS